MKWLIRLYPAEWRRRYGDEFAALLKEQHPTPGLLLDVLFGAIDARVDLHSIRAGSATVAQSNLVEESITVSQLLSGSLENRPSQFLGAC